jgi:hypothetical protein
LELAELTRLLKLLRENGVTKYSCGELSLELTSVVASPSAGGEERLEGLAQDAPRTPTEKDVAISEVEARLRKLGVGYERLFMAGEA